MKGARHRRKHNVWFRENIDLKFETRHNGWVVLAARSLVVLTGLGVTGRGHQGAPLSGVFSLLFPVWFHGNVHFVKFINLCLLSEHLPGYML